MTGDAAPRPGDRELRGWYRDWFGEEYLALYPHRDRAEARRAVDLLAELCPPSAGDRVLDLACGAGRHLEPLREAGWRPVGADLSRPLLRRARRRTGGAVPLVRADMRRLPLAPGAVDAVAQFFTSFGYFETRAEDRRVLREVRRVLRPGGCFLLDFLHAPHVRRNLVPEDETEVDGRRVRQTRSLEDGAVVKRIEIDPGGSDGPSRIFHERVRLYEPDELEEMMDDADLAVRDRRGDYRGGPVGDDAPRLILVGRAQ